MLFSPLRDPATAGARLFRAQGYPGRQHRMGRESHCGPGPKIARFLPNRPSWTRSSAARRMAPPECIRATSESASGTRLRGLKVHVSTFDRLTLRSGGRVGHRTVARLRSTRLLAKIRRPRGRVDVTCRYTTSRPGHCRGGDWASSKTLAPGIHALRRSRRRVARAGDPDWGR